MEQRNSNPLKTICMIIGVFLVVVLFPIYLFLPVSGGLATGAIHLFRTENVEELINSSGISAAIIEEGWKSTENKMEISEEFKPGVLQKIYNRILTEEEVNHILLQTWNAMYEGTSVSYDFTVFETRLQEELDVLLQELPQDLFAAWKGEFSSKYFTDSCIREMTQRVNDVFDGLSYEECKARYEMTGATEPFDRFLEEEWEKRKEVIALPDSIDSTGVWKEVEETLEETVNQEIANPETREFFTMLKKSQESVKLIYMIIYGILLVASLVVIALLFFAPVGCYITGAGMLAGGLICGIASAVHGILMKFVNRYVFEEMDKTKEFADSVEKVVRNLLENLLLSLEKEIGRFGRVSCILGIMLIGIGIFLHVMVKNKSAAE